MQRSRSYGDKKEFENIFAARPILVEEDDPILEKATKLELLSTDDRDFYILPVDEARSLSLASSERSLISPTHSDRHSLSEDSDSTRIYDLRTRETIIIRGDIKNPEKLNLASYRTKSLPAALQPRQSTKVENKPQSTKPLITSVNYKPLGSNTVQQFAPHNKQNFTPYRMASINVEENVGIQAPIAGGDEPSVGIQAPIGDLEEQTVGIQAPIAGGNEEPSVGIQAPIGDLEEQAAGIQAPIAELEEPSVGIQAPVAELEEPTVGIQAPVAELEEPTVGIQAPVVEMDDALPAGIQAPVAELNDEPVGIQAPIAGFRALSVNIDVPVQNGILAAPHIENGHPSPHLEVHPVEEEVLKSLPSVKELRKTFATQGNVDVRPFIKPKVSHFLN